MKIINLTPHAINILEVSTGVETTYHSEGLARVSSKPGEALGGFLFSAPTFGEVEGLPAPQEDTIFLVSSLVAARCVGRKDVYSPGTGPNDKAIRNEKGHIVAVTRLIQAPLS